MISVKFPEIKEASRKVFENAPPTHDFSHTMRVLTMCIHIGKDEHADLEILEAAALLHDIAREEADRNGTCHAKLSAEKALPVLETSSFPNDKIPQVIHCIATHRFRSDKPPLSLEAKILFDADKLDALGAIGICRAYAYCGENGQRLYNPFTIDDIKNPSSTRPKRITDHSSHTPIIEFRKKLVHLKDRLFTDCAKAIADERHKFMVDFFLRLYDEINGSR